MFRNVAAYDRLSVLTRRGFTGAANKSIKLTSSALTTVSSNSSVGFAVPLSIKLIAACRTLASAARSSWVQPRSFRSRRILAASVLDTAERAP
jgi:hypothetical protein